MTEAAKTFYEREVERIAACSPLHEHQYIQIRQSKAFIEAYHAEKIELTKMADAACMSRFHYIRVFQQIYGITPRQFLRDVRIHKAKDLLKKGHSVTRVCLDVGYDSLPTFSTVFKRGTGYSPLAYQRINQSNLE